MKTFNDFVTEEGAPDTEGMLDQIKKEHEGLKKMSLKDLKDHAASLHKVYDKSGLTSKDQAITHILTHKHGRKRCANALGWDN